MVLSLEKIVQTLYEGGLVVFPTDTVYGLLVDATNERAVKKLIQFKDRVPGKAISVFVSDFDMMKNSVEIGNNETFIQELLPGPYTIVLPAKHTTSKLLESEKGTLGIRIPQYEYITKLVKAFKKPVTATSANLSGDSPHYSISSLLKSLSKQKQQLIDLIIDGGELPRNKPSTVIDLTMPEVTILRHGDALPEKTFSTSSPEETKSIAKHLAEKLCGNVTDKPLIFIIEGELGAGKTVFVKGIGEYFGLHDIISPTFVVYYEYDIRKNPWKKFIHFDLYNIQEDEEFAHLGIEKYVEKGNILCFEWGEKAGKIHDELKEKGGVVHVKIAYEEEGRKITIESQNSKLQVKS